MIRALHAQLMSMAKECNWPKFYLFTIYGLGVVFLVMTILWAFTVPMHYKP